MTVNKTNRYILQSSLGDSYDIVTWSYDDFLKVMIYSSEVNSKIMSLDDIGDKEYYIEDLLCSVLLVSGKSFSMYSLDDTVEEILRRSGKLHQLVNLGMDIEFTDNGVRYTAKLVSSKSTMFRLKKTYEDKVRYKEAPDDIARVYRGVWEARTISSFDDAKERLDSYWLRDSDGNPKKKYETLKDINSISNFCKVLSKLEDKTEIGFKAMTTGNQIYYMKGHEYLKDHLIGIAISIGKDKGVYIPFINNQVELTYTIDQVMVMLYPHLKRLTIDTYMGCFEWKCMYDAGWTIDIGNDAYGIDRCNWSDSPKEWWTLKNLVSVYYGDDIWSIDDIFVTKKNRGKALEFADLELLTLVACAYADYSLQLCKDSIVYLNEGQYNCYKLDISVIEIVAKAEYYGVQRDVESTKRDAEIFAKDLAKIEAVMRRYVKEYGMAEMVKRHFEDIAKHLSIEELEVKGEAILEELMSSPSLIRKFDSQYEELMKGKCFSGRKLHQIVFGVLNYPVLSYTRMSKDKKKKEAIKKLECQASGMKYEPPKPNPATDGAAMLKLCQYELEEPSSFLAGDIWSSQYDGMTEEEIKATGAEPLISKKKINSLRYPFAYLYLLYSDKDKQLTTFFSKEKLNTGKDMYDNLNPWGSTTARLITALQTISHYAKREIRSFDDDYYFVDCDFAQFEIRWMAGEANRYWNQEVLPYINMEELSVYHRDSMDKYITALNNHETDIHRQSAAAINRIPEEDVTDAQRSDAKASAFGIPYARGSYASSIEDIMRYADQMDTENYGNVASLITTDKAMSIEKWKYYNYPLTLYFEGTRNKTFVNYEVDKEHRAPYFGELKMGFSENKFGRKRFFQIEDITEFERHSIRKESGNYPVQSGTRDMCFNAIKRMYDEFKSNGWVHNPTDGSKPKPDDVFFNLFIHDEDATQVKLSVHPFKIVKIQVDNCFITWDYHPNYYKGISFVNRWLDGKHGGYEIPVPLAKYIAKLPESKYPEYDNGYFIVKCPDGNVKRVWLVDYFRCLIKNWEIRRIRSEVDKLAGFSKNASDSDYDNLDYCYIADKLKNTFVRKLIKQYGGELSISKELSDRIKACVSYRTHNYLYDDFEDSHLVETSDKDLFEDIFSEDEDDTEDTSFFNEKVESSSKGYITKEEVEEIQAETNNYIYPTEYIEFKYDCKEREEYEALNIPKEKMNPAILIRIDGKVNINLKGIPYENRKALIKEIRDKYEDPNGSSISVITDLKQTKLDFKVWDVERKGLEELYAKYQ